MENYKNGKYRFRIYNEFNGELELDADFSSKNGECKKVLSSGEILPNIKGYVNDILFFKQVFCDMKPLYPAYGGSSWEIIKGKKDISN